MSHVIAVMLTRPDGVEVRRYVGGDSLYRPSYVREQSAAMRFCLDVALYQARVLSGARRLRKVTVCRLRPSVYGSEELVEDEMIRGDEAEEDDEDDDEEAAS